MSFSDSSSKMALSSYGARETIKTRILIMSDTLGDKMSDGVEFPKADVVIHCGNMTNSLFNASGSLPHEQYENTFNMLRGIPAPIKIAIPGPYDLCLDDRSYKQYCLRKLDENNNKEPHERDPDLQERLRNYKSRVDDAVKKFKTTEYGQNLVCTQEETRDILLKNGAKMKVYMSPYTYKLDPSSLESAFTYGPGGHEFNILMETDVAITHGPPLGIMDRAYYHPYKHLDLQEPQDRNIGCSFLHRALNHAKPRLHCFGSVHEQNGAQTTYWGDPLRSERQLEYRHSRHNMRFARCSGVCVKLIPLRQDVGNSANATTSINAARRNPCGELLQPFYLVEMDLPASHSDATGYPDPEDQ